MFWGESAVSGDRG
ncbi:hypothetical protein YPPY64_2584, partial [Yersinia pestis PY-64]